MFKLYKNHSKARETFTLFWKASIAYPRMFWLSLLYPVGAICISTLVPLFIGKSIALLAQPHSDHFHYAPELIGSIVSGLAANRIGFSTFQKFMAVTMKHLHEQAFTTLMRRSIGFHNNHVSGKLVSDVADYINAYQQMANNLIGVFIPFVAVLIVGSCLVFSESIWLGLIISGTALFAFTTSLLDSYKRSGLRMHRLAASQAVTSQLADSIVNAQTVKTFARENDEIAKHQKLALALGDLRAHDWSGAAIIGNNRIAMLFVFQIGFLLVLNSLIAHKPALLGVGIFAVSFTTTIFNRLFDVYTVARQVEESLLQAEPMVDVILGQPEIVDHPHAKKLHLTNGAVTFQDVSFAYQDSSQPKAVFEQLNLTIPAGQRIGLVGPSGGGKTTITRLLLRFEDIQAGSITIDDQNIAEVTQTSLRRAIAYVPQEPLLFHRTVAENIAYGKAKATSNDIAQAAAKAYALDFIQSLPDGFQTIVGERGVKLSGGQRQRIAIARAILKDAPILVLDEATSALDSESEAAIQKALDQLMVGRTTIVIAHRLSTIQSLDRIIVIDDGQIIEDGNHKTLLKADKLYARLWQRQSGGFIDEDSDA